MTSSPEQIIKIVDGQEKDIKSIKTDLLRMCWNMRGGITYNEALMLSHHERESIKDIIKDNYETTKKTGLPYF